MHACDEYIKHDMFYQEVVKRLGLVCDGDAFLQVMSRIKLNSKYASSRILFHVITSTLLQLKVSGRGK